MLFKIETKNPYSSEIEYYVVAGKDENEAKINFTMEFPNFRVRNVFYVEGNVLPLKWLFAVELEIKIC